MPRNPDSRDAIFKAAAAEFAAHGFAATTVDRIAERARLNKAMIYYHFDSKDALYAEILRDTFSGLGDRLAQVAASDAPPLDKLDRAIDTIAAAAGSHPHFPAMMVREIAEAGVHLDRATIATMMRVVTTLVGILEQGQQKGDFRRIDPVHTYFVIVAPLVLFLASNPVRARLRREVPRGRAPIDLATFAGPDDFAAMLAEHKRAIATLVAVPERASRQPRDLATVRLRRQDSRSRSN